VHGNDGFADSGQCHLMMVDECGCVAKTKEEQQAFLDATIARFFPDHTLVSQTSPYYEEPPVWPPQKRSNLQLAEQPAVKSPLNDVEALYHAFKKAVNEDDDCPVVRKVTISALKCISGSKRCRELFSVCDQLISVLGHKSVQTEACQQGKSMRFAAYLVEHSCASAVYFWACALNHCHIVCACTRATCTHAHAYTRIRTIAPHSSAGPLR